MALFPVLRRIVTHIRILFQKTFQSYNFVTMRCLLKFSLLVLFLGGFSPAWSQTDSLETDDSDDDSKLVKPESEMRYKLGVKMGVQTFTFLGSEPKGSKLAFGLLGGGYGRVNFKKGYSIQTEIQVSLRGSNFESATGEISAIRLLYIDMPFLVFKALDKDLTHRIGLGPQLSDLASSEIYIDGNRHSSGFSPVFEKYDISAVLAYQYRLPYFSIQTALKYGVKNLNLNKPWPNNAKPLNTNKSIHNFSFELNLIF